MLEKIEPKNVDIQIVLGSENDEETLQNSGALTVLNEIGISWAYHFCSAHRNPDDLDVFCNEVLLKTDTKVFIAAAGMKPDLPAAIASHARAVPVLGVVLDSSTIRGSETVATACVMPKGVPVNILGIGKAGLYNAAIAAAQIIALGNERIRTNLKHYLAQNNKQAKFNAQFNLPLQELSRPERSKP